MIDPEDTGDLAADVARRLAYTRQALGLDQQRFGESAGLSQPRYNQYETGRRLLTLQAAMLLCDRHLLTLDWIFRGDPSGLSARLNNQLARLRKTSRTN